MANQLAIVTGASSGIGYELARVFAENGFDLVINAEDERLQSAEQELKALGVQVTAVQADQATYDGVEEFWQAIEKLGGQSTRRRLMRESALAASLPRLALMRRST